MNLSVQWFVSVMVENNLLTLEDATAFYQSLGNPDLNEYAQAILNQFCSGLSQEEANGWVTQFQLVIRAAEERAATGEVPPAFASAQQSASSPAASPAADGNGAEQQKPVPAATPMEQNAAIHELSAQIRQIRMMNETQLKQFMRELLLGIRDYGASDLHLSSGAPWFIRKDLKLHRPDPEWMLPDEDCTRMNMALLTEEEQQLFKKQQDLNLAIEIDGSRFRTALMFHKDGMSASYRLVPSRVHSLEELGFLPGDASTLKRLLDYHNGLILVTGPLGSGKTSTLAAMVEVANQARKDHIITVEDPIEIVQQSKNCQITQRQIGTNTKSYATALKGALREDPDIIVIGEMNDLETIENAITASETGHLVIGTLHTCDAANTLNRILDVFPPNQQPQIRAMTSGSLRGVICQKLVPAAKGGLTIVYEILINTLAVANTISDGKIFQLKAAMQIGSKVGMVSIDQNIFQKYKLGEITEETAKDQIKDSSVMDMLKKDVAVKQAQAFAAAHPGKKK